MDFITDCEDINTVKSGGVMEKEYKGQEVIATYDARLVPPNDKYPVPIGKPLMLSPAFPPASTGHATFTASGAPSSIVSAVIHTHFFTLAKSVCYDLH